MTIYCTVSREADNPNYLIITGNKNTPEGQSGATAEKILEALRLKRNITADIVADGSLRISQEQLYEALDLISVGSDSATALNKAAQDRLLNGQTANIAIAQ